MSYNPNIHHRRSIRLKGYDYSREGLYFITICVQDRECLFGSIVVGDKYLLGDGNINGADNDKGDEYEKGADNEKGGHTGPPVQSVGASLCGCHDINKCPDVDKCPDINEIHKNGIENRPPTMILNDAGKMVERWYNELENKYPNKRCHEMAIMPNHFHCIIENLDLRLNDIECGIVNPEKYGLHNKKYNANIGDLVDWFKTMTTNEYIRGVKQFGWKRFDGKLWQRDYWEHIVRSTDEYERIANYIIDNPAKWRNDKFFLRII